MTTLWSLVGVEVVGNQAAVGLVAEVVQEDLEQELDFLLALEPITQLLLVVVETVVLGQLMAQKEVTLYLALLPQQAAVAAPLTFLDLLLEVAALAGVQQNGLAQTQVVQGTLLLPALLKVITEEVLLAQALEPEVEVVQALLVALELQPPEALEAQEQHHLFQEHQQLILVVAVAAVRQRVLAALAVEGTELQRHLVLDQMER